MTGLPVTRLAKMPGYPFQVGNVDTPIATATPRGLIRHVLSTTSGSRLPCGFSQRVAPGSLVISW